jgi:transcriptional regulator with XRE-family HTH domain
VGTIEGGLIAKWRKHLGLSQQILAEACPTPIFRETLSRIENGAHSASVETLLNLIRGMELAATTSLGETPEERLARFFSGPGSVPLTAAQAKRARAEIRKVAQVLRELAREEE